MKTFPWSNMRIKQKRAWKNRKENYLLDTGPVEAQMQHGNAVAAATHPEAERQNGEIQQDQFSSEFSRTYEATQRP